MKKNIVLLIAVLFSCCITAQEQTLYATKNQQLTWIGKAAVGSYAPEGTLKVSKASLSLENETVTQMEITVNMKSLQQENKQLTKHLKEEDFFYVSKYPEATFKLTETAKIEEGTITLKGIMTIRGISKEEIIEAKILNEKNTITLQFSTILDRTDYGVNHNSPSIFTRLKENAIADEFSLQGRIIFTTN